MKVRFLRPNIVRPSQIPPAVVQEEKETPIHLPQEEPLEAGEILTPTSEETHALADFYSLLSDPTRLKILLSLFDGERCVCDIADTCGMTKSAVSHQLALLRQGRFVTPRREGKNVYYALADHHVKGIIAYALQHLREESCEL